MTSIDPSTLPEWERNLLAQEDDTPTPIDQADLRPGRDIHAEQQASDRGWHAALVAVFQDVIKGMDGQAWSKSAPEFVTWHLVHRPDPDAEAVEALARSIHGGGVIFERSELLLCAEQLAALREQGWDVVRRAKS